MIPTMMEMSSSSAARRVRSGTEDPFCTWTSAYLVQLRGRVVKSTLRVRRVTGRVSLRRARRRRSELQRSAQGVVDGVLLVGADPACEVAKAALHDLLDRRDDSPTVALEAHREQRAWVLVDDLQSEGYRDRG